MMDMKDLILHCAGIPDRQKSSLKEETAMIYSIILKNGMTATMDDEELEAYKKRLKEEEERGGNTVSPADPKSESSGN